MLPEPDPLSPVSGPARPFVDAYLRARDLEHRLLPDDDVVRALPGRPEGDPLADEWRQRADTARRFTRYLAAAGRPLKVSDLGCGNGWFTARMAAIAHVTATGIDVNLHELEQARRVFGGRPRLDFVHDDFVSGHYGGRCHGEAPDIAVIASTLQYVADPSSFLRSLLGALAPGGEIHVLDSPIYDPTDVAAARERTRAHYQRIGVEEMVEHYYHHDWRVFDGLGHDVLHRPSTVVHRAQRRLLRRPVSQFPWIRITAGEAR